MELLIIFIVITSLLLMMGVEVAAILLGLMILMIALLGLTVVFFLIHAMLLLKTRRCRAVLKKVEKHPKFNYPAAFYEAEGEVYPNVFPCEVVLRNRLSPVGKDCTVRLDEKRKTVYDTNAFVCVMLGISLGSLSMIGVYAITRVLFV